MRIGFCAAYDNPHVGSPVDAAAVVCSGRVNKLILGPTPGFRSDNNWRGGGESEASILDPFFLAKCWRWIASSDVLVFWGASTPALVMPFVFLAACFSGKPVYMVSEGFRQGRTTFLRSLFLRLCSFSAEGCLLAAGNTAQREFSQAGLGWDSFLFGFAEQPPAKPPVAGRVTREPGPLRILGIGQLIPRKEWTLLLREVHAAGLKDRCEIRICGSGPQKVEISSLAAELGIRCAVVGFRRGENLAAELMWADVLVHPANYEGWGVVLNHALRFGLPVVVSRHVRSGQGVLVQHAANGFVFQDSNDLRETLSMLADNPDRCTALSAYAHRTGALWSPEELGLRLARKLRGSSVDYPPGSPLSRGPVQQDASR